MNPRLNKQSAGYWVAQDYDASDAFAAFSYDWTNIPLNYAARYGFVPDAHGFPVFQQVLDATNMWQTDGPVYGMICWPGAASAGVEGDETGRNQAQWSWIFPVRIYNVDGEGNVFAIPQLSGDSSGWADDVSLAPQQVFMDDGSAPAVDTFGLVVMGTSLAGQFLLFFEGGGGGSTRIPAVVTGTASGAGNYTWAEVTPSTNATIMGGRTGNAWERNRSPNVRTDGTAFVDVDTWPSGDQTFFYPLAMCTPP